MLRPSSLKRMRQTFRRTNPANRRKMTRTRAKAEDAQLDRVLDLYRNGQVYDTLRLLQQIVAEETSSADAHAYFGTLLCRCGALAQDVAHLYRAAELAPSDPVIRNELGHQLRCAGFFTHAETAFRSAIRLDTEYFVAYANLGSLLARTGQLTASIAAYTEAVRL